MSIKAGILGDAGTRSSNLAVWSMAGLGITIGLYSCHKWVEYCNRDNGIDRLPDDILSDIVSRLALGEASRTSILSRRWRNIWSMNPELIFTCVWTFDFSKFNHDHVGFGDRRRFLQAVNQCLQLYSGRNLKLFFLHCCFLNGLTCHLVQWMRTLARFDVEELFLGNSCRTCNGDPLDKPFTFYFKLIEGFSRLNFLDLTFCYVETTSVSRCNSLLTLILHRIQLFSHQLSDILMSCPNLTTLFIEQCDLPRNLRISGPNLKLETLDLSACYKVQKLEISDINIVSIMIHIRSEVQVLLSSVPKLERLHLRTLRMNYRFVDDPKQMPLLKYLLVQPKYQILGLPPTFQVFGNVRILRLTTRGYPFRKACKEVDLWNFAPVLVACPLLEEFYLLVGGPACKEEKKGQWPVLRHKHLDRMELSGFSGTKNELEFAKFVATSAQVLQTLVLRLSCRGYDDDDGEDLYFEDEKEKDSKRIDTEVARVYLKDEFLSEHAKVEFELL